MNRSIREAQEYATDGLIRAEFSTAVAANTHSAINLLEIFSQRPSIAKTADFVIANGRFHGFELTTHGEKLQPGTTSIVVGLENTGCWLPGFTWGIPRVAVIINNAKPDKTDAFLVDLDSTPSVEWRYDGKTKYLPGDSPTDIDILNGLTDALGYVADRFENALPE